MNVGVLPFLTDNSSQEVERDRAAHAMNNNHHLSIAVCLIHCFNQLLKIVIVASGKKLLCIM